MEAKDSNGCTALHKAAANGHSGCVKLLLDAGAKPDAESPVGNTPLHLVRQQPWRPGPLTSVHFASDWNRFALRTRRLVQASFSGHPDVVEQLLQKGSRADVANKSGNTPLHFAAQKGHATLVPALLKNSANLDAKSKAGNTPLHLAAMNGHTHVLQPLLELGHPIDHQCGKGNTALHLVRGLPSGARLRPAAACRSRVCHLCGAPPEPNGLASVQAAAAGHVEAVQALLAAGASIDTEHNDGKTALDVAHDRRARNVEQLPSSDRLCYYHKRL